MRLGSDVLGGSRAYAEELADREAEEAAAQAAEAEAAEAEAMETPERFDEYGIAIEDNDQQATPAQDAAEANVSAPATRTARVLEVGWDRAAVRSPLPGSAAGTLPALLPISSRAPSTLLPKTAMRLASRPTRSPSASQTSSFRVPREAGHLLTYSSPTRPTSPPMSCARCRMRSRTSPIWRSRAVPTVSISPPSAQRGALHAACRRPVCLRPRGRARRRGRACRQAGLSDVRIVHDLTNRPRIVRAIVTEPKQRQ